MNFSFFGCDDFSLREFHHQFEELGAQADVFHTVEVWPQLKKLTLGSTLIRVTEGWAPCLEELVIRELSG